MLENIIKKYLFEARGFNAVVKKADTRSYNDAMAADAVYAFDVVYKIRMGKDALPTEKEIMESVSSIISANPSVGASSKYAKGENKYVLSNNLKDSEKRMKWNVWIIPAALATDIDSDEVNVSASYPYKIGSSRLIPFKKLKVDEQTKYKNINKGAPVTAADDVIIDPTPIEKKADPNPPDVVEKGIAADDLFKKIESDPNVSPTKFTYPYTAQNGNVIYTMSDGDDYIYTYMNNVWKTMLKKDFESGKASSGILITDPNTNSTLNQKFGKDANINGISKIANRNDVVQFTKEGKAVKLYWWNGTKHVWANGQIFTPGNENELNVIYLGPSTTNPNYSLIQFPGGAGQKSIQYFVETKDIKPVK